MTYTQRASHTVHLRALPPITAARTRIESIASLQWRCHGGTHVDLPVII